MDKKEKNKRSFGSKLTARIARMIAKKEITKREQELGRKLSREEKNLIFRELKEKVRNKGLAFLLAGVIGIGGLGAGYLALSEGSKVPEVPEQHESGENSKEDWKDSLKVEIGEDEVSYTEEQEWIINEIDNLETKEDVLKWFKNFYLEEYEKVTGDDTTTTSHIKVTLNNQSFVYKLDNGEIVTHSFDINETEAAIKADGQNYTTQNDVDVYRITLDGKTIDSITSFGKKVIPGENYAEMKDYESVLEKIGNITNQSFALMGDFETGRSPEFVRSKLKDAVEEHYKNQNEQKKTQQNETQQEDDGR